MTRFRRYTEELRGLAEITTGDRNPVDLGTHIVVPDPKVVANDWLREKQATVGKSVGLNRAEWEEHAKRMLLSPEAAAIGWGVIASRPAGIAGVQPRGYIPGQHVEKPVQSPGRVATGIQPADSPFESKLPHPVESRIAMLRHRLEGTTTPLSGYYVGMPWLNSGPNQPMSDAPGFPFSTEAAERVWKIAQGMIAHYPEASPSQIFMLAVEKSNIELYELTPEDGRMLELAIAWAQNGPPQGTGNRIGGMPGGPANSTGGRQRSGGGL